MAISEDTFGCQDSQRWVEARLLNIPQCTGWPIPQYNKGPLAPMSAVPKLRSPDVEKTQGSQAMLLAMNGSRAKPHSVHGVLLLLPPSLVIWLQLGSY